ncbi:MAG TPA: hypothetical protein DC064_01245 [Cyanobacteria bacterium UBA9273]|nr:hypothetical protein [Cyanobacteria bacterium UBA9273]
MDLLIGSLMYTTQVLGASTAPKVKLYPPVVLTGVFLRISRYSRNCVHSNPLFELGTRVC